MTVSARQPEVVEVPVDGRQLIGHLIDEPVLGLVDLYLDDHREVAVGPGLAKAGFAAVQQADRVVVRVDPSETEPETPFKLMASLVQKRCDLREHASDYEIRPVGADSEDFVRRLLVQALLNGYGEAAVSRTRLERYVDHAYRFQPEGDLSSLVAWDGDRCIGHVSWTTLPTVEDADEPTHEIIDTFVLAEYEGKGVTQSLTARLEHLAGAGATLRGSIISEPRGEDARVLCHLQQDGWWLANRLWQAERPTSPR